MTATTIMTNLLVVMLGTSFTMVSANYYPPSPEPTDAPVTPAPVPATRAPVPITAPTTPATPVTPWYFGPGTPIAPIFGPPSTPAPTTAPTKKKGGGYGSGYGSGGYGGPKMPFCKNKKAFTDKYGVGCKWYAQKPKKRCPMADGRAGYKGSASDACCVCGGGKIISLAPTESPTPAPSTAPTSGPTTAPTPAPTEYPTTSPVEKCRNFKGFKDKTGKGCKWYSRKSKKRCYFANKKRNKYGQSAAVACCACGGGTVPKPKPWYYYRKN
mmetsp:Transcript_28316/g.77745  ORF Transcript_28316/g.77745 Transcript_28316/m.77745 type:complete len:269 (+) Transcript_28316:223-1029(+)|eukprot:CAMPEP_0168728610 /NCGR_PEP_ID=MMETSP0724-20121128/5774_1 /TAXON_ID=265536 /ORGANISM="Amphiprora sp., Strain CCMP467" /LENGTH=268 /DNA_ID=CAMNT_0008775463 /DNA_START=188 /DNA_END=994 /DNA_ORIENTATION=+